MIDKKELEKIKKILESCPINFLIGSGASTNYFETLNLVENLLPELSSNSNRDSNEFKIIDCSLKYAYFQKCIRGDRGLTTFQKLSNLENINQTQAFWCGKLI
jgi:hypothetical protein